MAQAEDVEHRQDLYKKIAFQVIPVRVIGFKEFGDTAIIRVMKKVGEIFPRIAGKQVVFLDAEQVKIPGIIHFGQSAIIGTDPAIKNARHYFYQEKNDQLWLAQTRTGEEFYFGDQPGKKDKIGNEQQVFQSRYFIPQ